MFLEQQDEDITYVAEGRGNLNFQLFFEATRTKLEKVILTFSSFKLRSKAPYDFKIISPLL